MAASTYTSAVPIVESAWANRAADASQLLYTSMNMLNYAVPTIVPAFELPPDVVVEFGTFLRPVAPALPTMPDIDATIPSAPSPPSADFEDVGDAPAEPVFDLTFSKPSAPNVAVPARPADMDITLEVITVPDQPVFDAPAEPVFYAVEIPVVDALIVPEFDGNRPVLKLSAPTQTFAWEYSAYDGGLTGVIKSRLSDMIVNGLALPAYIEQQIFDRLRDREGQLSLADEQEAFDVLAGRRIRQPAGMAARMLEMARTKNRRTTSAGNRDIALKMADQQLEAIKIGLAEGARLEIALYQNNIQENELRLKAAQAAQEIAIALFNAAVALHNAEVEGYKADAQVFAERIRALQAQADVIKTRMEGAKILGDLNETLVRAYTARVAAIGEFTKIYLASVEAAKVRGELNVQRLEQQRLVLQAYTVDVDAYGKQWDAFGKQVDAEVASSRMVETAVNVYSERNRAYGTRVQAAAAKVQAKIQSAGLVYEGYRAQLEGVKTYIAAKSTQVQAVGTIAGAQATIFSAEAQVSASEAGAADRKVELAIAKYKAGADVALKKADTVSSIAIKNAELGLELVRGKAAIASQLASSVMSGVSASAGISFSGSEGYSSSRSSSVGWQGEATDWTGGLIT